MADQLIEEQLADFNECFAVFDGNKDGRITLQELCSALNSLGQNPTEEDLQVMVQGLEVGDDDTIDFPTFLSLMSKKLKGGDIEEELIEAFKVFDKDGTGYISAGNLSHVMSNLGEKITGAEVDEMIKDASGGKDGIYFEEFVKMMMAKSQ